MKKIKFSVLMSVYHKENSEYLKQAMESIVNQTLLPNEIILVEDGPLTKELDLVIKEFQKNISILRVVKLPQNVGLGNALNAGLKHCHYEYVARMDTDDISVNNRFEKQIDYLTKHPEVDVLGSNMIEYDENMINKISRKNVPETNDEIRKYLKKRNPMNHPTVIFRRQKVIDVNSYEDYLYFEDYYLWAKMIKKDYIFYNIQKDLYHFRAGSYMYKRRGGLDYLRHIKKLETGLLNLELINKFEYLENILIRYCLSVCPNKIRKLIYNKKLRTDKNEENK